MSFLSTRRGTRRKAARDPQAGGTASRIVFTVAGLLAISVLVVAGSVYYRKYMERSAMESPKQGPTAQGSFRTMQSLHAPSHPQPHPETREPCSLIAREEISQAVGYPIERAVAIGNSCRYEARDPMQWVLLDVLWEGGAAAMKGTRSALKSITGSRGAPPSPEIIGDDTYIPPESQMLMFVKGDVRVEIEVHGTPNNIETDRVIARRILARF